MSIFVGKSAEKVNIRIRQDPVFVSLTQKSNGPSIPPTTALGVQWIEVALSTEYLFCTTVAKYRTPYGSPPPLEVAQIPRGSPLLSCKSLSEVDNFWISSTTHG